MMADLSIVREGTDREQEKGG